MTQKLSLRLNEIKSLDLDTLAKLVSAEARYNKPFKKAIKSALFTQENGVDDLIKIITLECDALNTNIKFIPLEKLSGFCKELRQISDSICNDLARISPQKAVIYLLAFIRTHEEVFQYVEDPGFIINELYRVTLDRLGPIVLKLNEDERDKLLELIIDNFNDSLSTPFFEQALQIVCPILEISTLKSWDQRLQALYQNSLYQNCLTKIKRKTDDQFGLEYIIGGRTIIALNLQEKISKMGIQDTSLDIEEKL